MKISLGTITAAALASTAAAVEFSVSSCADLIALDEDTLTSLVVTSSPIECDDYLRFVVRNDMTLSAPVPEVVLSNIALKIKDGLEVVIEPDIVFRDVYQVVSSVKYFSRWMRISPFFSARWASVHSGVAFACNVPYVSKWQQERHQKI